MTESVVGYLEAVDALAPGLVEGFYLEGSAALGDFQPHSSDIDFVAVTADRPDTTALGTLAEVHAKLRNRRRPFLDGVYVTWEDLPRGGADDRRRPRQPRRPLHPRRQPAQPGHLAHAGPLWRAPSRPTARRPGDLDGSGAAHPVDHRQPRPLLAAPAGPLDATGQPGRRGVTQRLRDVVDCARGDTVALHARDRQHRVQTGRVPLRTGNVRSAMAPDRQRGVAAAYRRGWPVALYHPTHLSRRRDVRDYAAMVIESAQALVNR
ncbi:nucleotidyltransferase domain-containing protein [Fodinicola feengrottensis]|uniref:nucleotidyltransferase domain-containing protein n=1 Tax=Fodinicola feengrottensis TaxID=435914 RepID=UPI002442AC18|nr:nucleotidyltransferase domain-containing protein [Fodinicola feengrottensis]